MYKPLNELVQAGARLISHLDGLFPHVRRLNPEGYIAGAEGIWELTRDEFRSHLGRAQALLECVNGSQLWRSARDICRQAEFLVDQRFMEEDPGDCETGYSASRAVEHPWQQLEADLARSQLAGAMTPELAAKELLDATTAFLDGCASVRTAISCLVVAVHKAGDRQYTDARCDYEGSKSNLERKIDALRASLALPNLGVTESVRRLVECADGVPQDYQHELDALRSQASTLEVASH
ncbi:MAG: hypothetical protein K2Z81_13530 [Cyanobacteria bacterium]|nr:hypothetical protein [Cyanobacteriota bacterium]